MEKLRPSRSELLNHIIVNRSFMRRANDYPYQGDDDIRVVNAIKTGTNRLILAHSAIIYTSLVIAHEVYSAIR